MPAAAIAAGLLLVVIVVLAMTLAAGRPAPPKPEFILPDRARSGVIWAHAINVGWQMAEATREV